ncbi:hypothetical protein PI125_g18085 [Phytophthora idaei]|nr:hypothetical protein PI125_g18085 [Phytophthora idaei]KAG3142638.1 hypothetical protein PI126_g14964 [Phytophthora idaei]
MMEPGATPKNTIIDKNQMEGAHFDIANVWWDDVCEYQEWNCLQCVQDHQRRRSLRRR